MSQTTNKAKTKETTTMAKAKTETASSSLVSTISDADLAALMSEGTQSAEVLSLGEGESFRGELVGRGQDIDIKDEAGDPKILKTWRFNHSSGALVDIMSCYQLEKDLGDIGSHPDVFIMKQKKKDIGGKMVNQYKVIRFDPKGKTAKA